MKGRKCRCGFATLADKARCPRCGKATVEAEWQDSGRVLSSVRLDEAPKGFVGPMDLVMVAVEGDGPKVTCWSSERLAPGDGVALEGHGTGPYTCSRKT